MKAWSGGCRSRRIEAKSELLVSLLEARPEMTIEELRLSLINHGYVSVVVALSRRTCPLVRPSIHVKAVHHKIMGSNN